MKIKSFAPLMAYAAVAIGLYWAHSAWAALLGFHASLLFLLAIGKPSVPIGALIKGNDLATLIACILLGASVGAGLYLARLVNAISPALREELAGIGLASAAWPAFIAYFALVNPWIEEYFWRGYLGDPSGKILLIDFYFAGYHLLVLYGKTNWPWMLASLFTLAWIGWLWRQVYRKADGLLIPALSHMAADFSILTAVYWMTK